MKTEKYAEMDRAIREHIARGEGHPIYNNALWDIAKPLLSTNRTPFPEEWRLIDRRMQAMRKAGLLEYDRQKRGKKSGCETGWRVVNAQSPN